MGYLEEFKLAQGRSDFEANALLFHWLESDEDRPKLYAELREKSPVLEFTSRAKHDDAGRKTFSQPAVLLTSRELIGDALQNLSSDPYKGIGSGTFVLASKNDGDENHEEKRNFLAEALRHGEQEDGAAARMELHTIAFLACRHAFVAPSKGEEFDLVRDIAEQAALRFVTGFFGFDDRDHGLLQETMRAGYETMIYQMFSRHFVTEPTVLMKGNLAFGALARRVGELLTEATDPSMRLEIASLIDGRHAEAQAVVESLLDQLVSKDPRCEVTAREIVGRVAEEGLSYCTAELIENTVISSTIRDALLDGEFAGPEADARREIFEGLIEIMIRAGERTLELRDRLIPRATDNETRLNLRRTVIELMARSAGRTSSNGEGSADPWQWSGNELATAVVGAIAGLMGNVTAGVSIAINEFFRDGDLIQRMTKLAQTGLDQRGPDPITTAILQSKLGAEALEDCVLEAMRLQPPAAFIPRIAAKRHTFETVGEGGLITETTIEKGTEVVLPIGAATRDPEGRNPEETSVDEFDEKRNLEGLYIFGHSSLDLKSHRCLGEHLSILLISHIVRDVLLLPGLAQQVHEKTGDPIPLGKKWGYICESFPLRYSRGEAIRQQPLNVIMKVRTPVAEHAERLKLVIQYGAPMIEHLLENSKMVHFARFVFLNNDSELGLFTSYDGEFEPYLKHFAQKAGPLFDLIFEHIVDPPPSPVREHQTEFVQHLRQYDIAPVGNYFFSAFPGKTVLGE